MLQISNTREATLGTLKVVVYGPAGIGKSTFGATFPRPIFLDCEGGLLSLRDRGVDYIRCRSVREVAEALALLRSKGEAYETVVVDSITEVVRMVIDEIRPLSTAPAGPMSLREWGRCIDVMRRLVRAFRDLPLHTVFTALPRETRSSTGEVIAVKPALPGRLADEVCASVDFVFYLGTRAGGGRTEATARSLLTTCAGRIYAKDRSGKLPLWIEPTWDAITTVVEPRQSLAA